MVQAAAFNCAESLNNLINKFNLTRENIIDIKWACNTHGVYGLLVFDI